MARLSCFEAMNCLSPVIVQGSFVFAAAVLTEAALSFLGVGVPPYIPSWGNILSEGRLYLQQAPWLVLYPGAAIMITINHRMRRL